MTFIQKYRGLPKLGDVVLVFADDATMIECKYMKISKQRGTYCDGFCCLERMGLCTKVQCQLNNVAYFDCNRKLMNACKNQTAEEGLSA